MTHEYSLGFQIVRATTHRPGSAMVKRVGYKALEDNRPVDSLRLQEPVRYHFLEGFYVDD